MYSVVTAISSGIEDVALSVGSSVVIICSSLKEPSVVELSFSVVVSGA